MDRALVTSGVSVGTTLAIALRLLDKAERQLAPSSSPSSCPVHLFDTPDRSFDLASLVLGIFLGFLLWPVLELLLQLRILLQQSVLRRVHFEQVEPPARRASYRLC